jgi:phage/plasmid-associated DNA primase
LFYKTLASGLRGRTLQKFIIWSGIGANSKGVTNKIVRAAFGEDLYYKGNNSVLTQEIKGDLCVGIANMNNKRNVVYEEPSVNKKILTSIMKEITGGDVMAYRGLYVNKARTNMRATHILMCNKKPLLDKIEEAVNRRLIIIPFESQFRTKSHIDQFIPEGTPNVFVAKDGVEDTEFLEKMKLPFLHILLKYYEIFKKNGYQIINVPTKCQALVKEYMTASDEFTTWFNDEYEFTNMDDDYVQLAEVYQRYKNSELYENLDKKTRRLKGTKKVIIADIKENPTMKMYFRERFRKNGHDLNNVMIRYKKRQAEDGDDFSDDE